MSVVSYIGLGSNLGNREANIKMALELLHHPPVVVVKRVAPFYLTAPVGFTGQAEFLNTVAEVETTIQPAELLRLLLSIEVELGRERTVRWGPRTIDLDLLLYGCLKINEPDLIVPHPRLHERAFVLVPLADLAPALELPGRGKVAVLAVRLAEEQEIKRL